MLEKPPKTSDRQYYLFALRIVSDFGATIAVPAILAAWIGTWLDEKYNRAPLFLAICLIVAFAATARIIQKKAKKYGEEYQKM
ncbi:MAG: AtpZ/AtpI family protein [Candidatus Magasanikbacteria bacterium]|jgi:F0F1-type ATP synthase assembly protein I